MRRLSESELHILSVAAKRGRISIALPIPAEWSAIAKTLALLALPNAGILIGEKTEDGPTYALSEAGREKTFE